MYSYPHLEYPDVRYIIISVRRETIKALDLTKSMRYIKVSEFNEEIKKAKNAINSAENCDYRDKSIKMYLENAITYLQNAKKLTK